MNGRLNIVVVPTEVTWKWRQYGNNFIAVFALSPLPSKVFYNLSAKIQWQADEIKVTFNEMPFEQTVTSSFNKDCPPRSGKMDWSSLGKTAIKWGSFSNTGFSCKYCEIFKNTYFEKTTTNGCFCRM